ncbi:MAG: hypothetical protein LQ339_007709 [Xanthoria mediterranea]|nr:MAG: hypothetical protein LQ339_007709 [Xanthoria mediterranea]
MDRPETTHCPEKQAARPQPCIPHGTQVDLETSNDFVFLVYDPLRREFPRSTIPVERAYRSIHQAIIWCEDELGFPHSNNIDEHTDSLGTWIIRDDIQEPCYVIEKMKLDKAGPGGRAQEERGVHLGEDLWLVCERRVEMVNGLADGIEDDFAARTGWDFKFRVLCVCVLEEEARKRQFGALFPPIGVGRSCDVGVVACGLF